jgi:hypothetical protein
MNQKLGCPRPPGLRAGNTVRRKSRKFSTDPRTSQELRAEGIPGLVEEDRLNSSNQTLVGRCVSSVPTGTTRPGARIATKIPTIPRRFKPIRSVLNKSEADQLFEIFLGVPGIFSAEQHHIAPPARWRFRRNAVLKQLAGPLIRTTSENPNPRSEAIRASAQG